MEAAVDTTLQGEQLVWEAEGQPVSVRLSQQVIGRLGMAVLEGFKSLPRRGLETGGLLIGTRRKSRKHVVVDIDDFEPVDSEHAAGPSYLLSDADRRLLESRLAVRRKSVVGFYRSHTRHGFEVTMEDTYLFSTYFRDASDVFLLIKSNNGAPPTAGFLIREKGKFPDLVPQAQFPFVQNAVAPALRDPNPPLPSPAPVAPPWFANRWILATCALALALAAGLSLTWGNRNGVKAGLRPAPPRAAAIPPLALRVTNTGNTLRLSWNHQAGGSAARAVLWIEDGSARQRVDLDANQLREGSIEYWPTTADVNFRLELPGATESVRAIGAPAKPAAEPAAAIAPATVQSPKPPRIEPPAPVTSTRAPRTWAFALPTPSVDGTPAAVRLPDPPVPAPAHAQPLANLEPVRPTVLPPAAPRAEPTATPPAHNEAVPFQVTIEPVPASRLERVAGRIPLVGKHYRDYVPAAPLDPPTLAGPLSRTVAHPINIDVRVYVNPDGSVRFAELLSTVPAGDPDLAAAAVFSARHCRYTPARLGDEPLAGEVILHYRFGGPQ